MCQKILRRVATNSWIGGCEDLQLISKTSWYYNWSLSPSKNILNCITPGRKVEFVAMIWGLGSITPNLIANIQNGITHLLSFNEPNFKSQSNIMPK